MRQPIRASWVALLLLALPARAATPLIEIVASPDVTATFDGTVIADHGAGLDDLVGTTIAFDIPGLPPTTDLVALHEAAEGLLLYAVDSTVTVGGITLRPSDVALSDAGSHSLFFDGSAAGVPAAARIDAIGMDLGLLLLSFDVDVDLGGATYRDEDLVAWDGVGFSSYFVGADAGVAAELDLDAAHVVEASGRLLLSFDAGGTVGGVLFADEDLLEYDPAGGGWEPAFRGRDNHPAWGPADLDAVSVRTDADQDGAVEPFDTCPAVYDPAQLDQDLDGEGDRCDPDDGLTYLLATGPDVIDWQAEIGVESWNWYRGDLDVLRATGVYTQPPGSNPLAARDCGLGVNFKQDPAVPTVGKTAFYLVSGVSAGVEGSLGLDGTGADRPNDDQCTAQRGAP